MLSLRLDIFRRQKKKSCSIKNIVLFRFSLVHFFLLIDKNEEKATINRCSGALSSNA